MLKKYLENLYERTMRCSYELAYSEIASSVQPDSELLDCGAYTGGTYDLLAARCGLRREQYHGLEWDAKSAEEGRRRGFDIIEADLNKPLPLDNERFSCVYALSVLEHLLNGCRFLKETHRILKPGGKLVLLTPNISTYFTAALILAGKMPSSGPHPDSNALMRSAELFSSASATTDYDTEGDTPVLRHLVVFSFKALKTCLRLAGFSEVKGRGFGLYPFPNFTQPALERIDPWHCHQMVFVARKPG